MPKHWLSDHGILIAADNETICIQLPPINTQSNQTFTSAVRMVLHSVDRFSWICNCHLKTSALAPQSHLVVMYLCQRGDSSPTSSISCRFEHLRRGGLLHSKLASVPAINSGLNRRQRVRDANKLHPAAARYYLYK